MTLGNLAGAYGTERIINEATLIFDILFCIYVVGVGVGVFVGVGVSVGDGVTVGVI